MALVLVVDDSRTARSYFRAILAAAGHEVIEAFDAEHALDRLADRPPDCIVLDLNMPGLSGTDLMELLGGRRESPPVVVVTSSQDDADRARCRRLGAKALLDKPVSVEQLTRAVNDAVAARVPRPAGPDDAPRR